MINAFDRIAAPRETLAGMADALESATTSDVPISKWTDWLKAQAPAAQHAAATAPIAAPEVSHDASEPPAEQTKESLWAAVRRAPMPVVLIGLAGVGLVITSFAGGRR